MSEPIIEQIAQWINDTLDGVSDPDATLTLRSVRPKVLDWSEDDFRHGDLIIEIISIKTLARTTVDSRTELALFHLSGIIRDLPANTATDTVLARLIETIRRTLLAGNTLGRACDGLALNVECPETIFWLIKGGLVGEVSCEVKYQTALKDGYL
jgi:hypothetical protein